MDGRSGDKELASEEAEPIMMGYGTQGIGGGTEELLELLETSRTTEVQWAVGGSNSVCLSQILWSSVQRRGPSVRCTVRDGDPTQVYSSAWDDMRDVSVGSADSTAPHRQQPRKQRPDQSDDTLRAVSCAVALGAREEGVRENESSLLCSVREGGAMAHQAWDVPDALPAMEEVRRPAGRSPAITLACTDIFAHRWPVGRGQPQAPHEPPRTAHGVVNRSHALRAYGNAVVPQVASLAWQTLFARIVESERRR